MNKNSYCLFFHFMIVVIWKYIFVRHKSTPSFSQCRMGNINVLLMAKKLRSNSSGRNPVGPPSYPKISGSRILYRIRLLKTIDILWFPTSSNCWIRSDSVDEIRWYLTVGTCRIRRNPIVLKYLVLLLSLLELWLGKCMCGPLSPPPWGRWSDHL